MTSKEFKTAVVVLGSIGYLAFVIIEIALKVVGWTREPWIIVLFPIWAPVLLSVLLFFVTWVLMKVEENK